MSVELKLQEKDWHQKENSQPIYLVVMLLLVLLAIGLGWSMPDESGNVASYYMSNGFYPDGATLTEILPEMKSL